MKLVLKRVVSQSSEGAAGNIASHIFYWLEAGQALVVGRSGMEADVVCRDQKMSQRHFQVQCGAQASLLRDLGSSNGTFLNGKRVAEAELADGDEIQAADTLFLVRLCLTGGVDVDELDDDAIHTQSEQGVAALPQSDDDATLHAQPAAEANDGWELELAELPSRPPTVDGGPESPAKLSAPESPPPSFDVPMCVTVFVHDGPFLDGSPLVSRRGVWLRPGQSLIVGRLKMRSDLTIGADSHLSGRHFELSCENRRCVLTDLESSNGTLVNNVAVKRTLLRNKDLIRAGNTVFAIVIDGGEMLTDEEVRASMIRAEMT